jgi:D-alanyl-D-alanine carboxypeptidase
MNKIYLFLGFLMLARVTIAQTIDTKKLDQLFDILNAENEAMSSIAISQNGAVVYRRSIGYRDAEGTMPSNELTKYRIGSITKMFTAVMIFQLIEEGKLTLDTRLNTFFPQIPNAGEITIRQLLSHRTGIHNFTDDASFRASTTVARTHDEMLEMIKAGDSDFAPDTKCEYSNSNFVLLGYMVEKLTSMKYNDALQSRIVKRAGLRDIYIGAPADVTKNECFSFYKEDKWTLASETDMSIPEGAGAIVCTPTELTHFIESLFALKLMNEKSFNEMKTFTGGMGLGIFQIPFGQHQGYGHNGGIDGFASILSHFPEDKLTIAYCSNGESYPLNDILIGVLSICYGLPYEMPEFKVIELPSEELDQFVGNYSSPDFPMKITIYKQEDQLMAKATGQSSFPLQAVSKTKFKFDAAGIVLKFHPETNEMTLLQGGNEVRMKME